MDHSACRTTLKSLLEPLIPQQMLGRVIRLAFLWGTLIATGYAILNWPLLNPVKFWGLMHGDQNVLVTFMYKLFGDCSYSRDFVLQTAPQAASLNNPLNLWLLHQFYQITGHDIPASFLWLLLPFVFLYVFVMYLFCFGLSRSNWVSGIMASISTQHFCLAFNADCWGIGTIGTSRAAYYVLPFVVIGAITALLSLDAKRPLGVILAFVPVGLVACLHPVSAYHMFFIFSIVGMGVEIGRDLRWITRFLFRCFGFAIGAIPTIISVLQHRLYVPDTKAALIPASQLLEAMNIVNPTYWMHIMPYPCYEYIGSSVVGWAFDLPLAFFVSACIFALILIFWRRITNRPLAVQHKKMLWLLVYSSSFPTFYWLTTGPIQQPEMADLKWHVLPIAMLFGAMILNAYRVWLNGPTKLDNYLLAVFTVALLFCVIGSWAINGILQALNYPVRFWEQLRGIRIALLVVYAWTALSMHAQSDNGLKFGKVVVLSIWIVTFIVFVIQYSELTCAQPQPADVDLVHLCDWAKQNTAEDAVFAVLTHESHGSSSESVFWDTSHENILFKACAKRSLAYSYDAIMFTVTQMSALVEAKNRMDAIYAVRKGSLPLSSFMKEYDVDYAIVSRSAVNASQDVAYTNSTFAVIRR